MFSPDGQVQDLTMKQILITQTSSSNPLWSLTSKRYITCKYPYIQTKPVATVDEWSINHSFAGLTVVTTKVVYIR